MPPKFNNFSSLKGTVYLQNANYTKWNAKPFVDGKIVIGDGPLSFLHTIDFFAIGYPAIELLAHIQAQNDEPIKARLVGSIVARNGISIVKATELDYYVSPFVLAKAQELLDKLKNGDPWLTANFQKSIGGITENHKLQLVSNHRTPITAD